MKSLKAVLVEKIAVAHDNAADVDSKIAVAVDSFSYSEGHHYYRNSPDRV